MRAVAPVLLLALGACKGDRPDATRTWILPAAGLQRARIFCAKGAVEVDTRAGNDVAVRGVAHGTQIDDFVAIEDDTLVVRRHDDGRIAWTVAVPPGLRLEVVGIDAAVTVRGAWEHAEVRTERGGIEVRAARIGGGRIRSIAGRVDVDIDAPPVRDLACESLESDVAVTIPSTFHGSVHASGRLDVPDHPALWKRPSVQGDSLNGFVGERPTQGEYEAAHRAGKPPPGVWARAPNGTASLRLKGG